MRAGQGQRAPQRPGRPTTTIVARHYVLAAGAINSPAVLLRSQAPDPHGRLGMRTFLHPVVMSAAFMDQKVEGWQGAPQTIYTDHFLGNAARSTGPIGFKLEAPPHAPGDLRLQRRRASASQQAELLAKFPNTHVLLALMRDGFHPQAPGGRVKLRGDGSPVLDYPLTDFVMDGARRAMLAMAEIQFAAGARQVLPVHELARPYNSLGPGEAGDRRAADEAAAHQGRQRARDGRLRPGRR